MSRWKNVASIESGNVMTLGSTGAGGSNAAPELDLDRASDAARVPGFFTAVAAEELRGVGVVDLRGERFVEGFSAHLRRVDPAERIGVERAVGIERRRVLGGRGFGFAHCKLPCRSGSRQVDWSGERTVEHGGPQPFVLSAKFRQNERSEPPRMTELRKTGTSYPSRRQRVGRVTASSAFRRWCRGTSGLHRAWCWVTPSRGDPQDSATESRPPMARPPGRAQVRVKRCGKSAPAPGVTRVALQTPPGARSNRGRAARPMALRCRHPRVDRTSRRATAGRDGWSPRTSVRTESGVQANSLPSPYSRSVGDGRVGPIS